MLPEDADQVIDLQCLEGMIDPGFCLGEIRFGMLRAQAATTTTIREDPTVDHG
jgi:hypothetical protein